MELKLLASSLAVLCVVSKVVCRRTCPPGVEYMWSFGEYRPVYPVTRIIAEEMPSLVEYVTYSVSDPYCRVYPVRLTGLFQGRHRVLTFSKIYELFKLRRKSQNKWHLTL